MMTMYKKNKKNKSKNKHVYASEQYQQFIREKVNKMT